VNPDYLLLALCGALNVYFFFFGAAFFFAGALAAFFVAFFIDRFSLNIKFAVSCKTAV